MDKDEDDEDSDSEDEGLFTVVDAGEARDAMESRERQRRCKATTDPEQEAVNARMHISFVCRVCDKIHYPDKPPKYTTNKRGRTRMVGRPLPEGCENMIPSTPDMNWIKNDVLTMSLGKYIPVPEHAERFKRKPYDNEDICVALADIDGYVKRKREDYLATRRAVIESFIKTPFAGAPKATRIEFKKDDENHEGCEGSPMLVSSVYIGNDDLGASTTAEMMFPISTILGLGAYATAVLDLTEDFMMMLFHVRSEMKVNECRRNAMDVYKETREKLMENPNLEIFHEHYLLVNTNAVNRDCVVYEVPHTVVKIKDAVELVDAGKARQVR